MATAVRRRSRVFESTTRLTGRVDRERGVISGVKVLGTTSSNGRRYLPEAIRDAAHLYEGASVRIDHPDDPEDQRSSDSVLGWLRDVRIGDDGSLYADLHYLQSHPFAKRLVEAAERNPRLLGLSHNASGDTDVDRDGTVVVHSITEVRSVDLVADPATTRGLFESIQSKAKHASSEGSERMTKITLREHFAKIPLLAKDKRLVEKIIGDKLLDRKLNAKFLEAGYMMDAEDDMALDAAPPTDAEPETAAPMADDVADMSPEDALKQGFRTAMMAVLDDATLDLKAKKSRLAELLTALDKLTAAGVEVPEAEDEAKKDEMAVEESDESESKDEEIVEECDDAKKDEMVKENRALKAELNRFKQIESARDLCESMGYQPDSLILEALIPLDEAKRKQLITRQKAAATPTQAAKPRTAMPLPEGKREVIKADGTAADVSSVDDFVKRLLSSRN